MRSARPQRSLLTRDARALDVTRGELAGPRWRSPFRGVHSPASASPDDPLQRIFDAAELLPPGAALGGWAAAWLLGARELDGRGPTGRHEQPVPIVLPPPRDIRRRDGIALWRSRLDDADVTHVSGIPCTSGVRTGFDLARLSDLMDAVVALDVLGRCAHISPATVSEYARARLGWRGVPMVRAAVDLSDPRVLSPGETRLRVIWVRDAGLPRPEANPNFFDTTGFFLGMGDLLCTCCGLLGEYDGAQHRDSRTHATDNAREEWLEDTGLTVVRAGDVDVGSQRRRTVVRLITAHRRASTRNRSQDRWTWTARPFPA